MASTLKAARAALMLIPILGIHFLMMPIRYVDYVDCCAYLHKCQSIFNCGVSWITLDYLIQVGDGITVFPLGENEFKHSRK